MSYFHTFQHIWFLANFLSLHFFAYLFILYYIIYIYMYPLVIPIPPEKLCVHVYLRVQRYPLNRCWDVQGVVEKVKFLKPYQPKNLTWQRKITIFIYFYEEIHLPFFVMLIFLCATRHRQCAVGLCAKMPNFCSAASLQQGLVANGV